MIGTDQFAYIHYPKTGGTFVTKALFELEDLLHTSQLRSRRIHTRYYRTELKHGTVRDIPRSHRALPVLATVRNPFELYVSEYEFGWWKREEYPRFFRRLVRGFRKKYPQYPELSFPEFVQLFNEAFCWLPKNRNFESRRGVGWLSERFVRFYFRHPWRFLVGLKEDHIRSPSAEQSISHVTFLHTDNLSQELYEYLLHLGHPADRLGFILGLGKVLPEGKGRTDDQRWEDYYTEDFRSFIRHRERLLFRLFPEFDS